MFRDILNDFFCHRNATWGGARQEELIQFSYDTVL